MNDHFRISLKEKVFDLGIVSYLQKTQLHYLCDLITKDFCNTPSMSFHHFHSPFLQSLFKSLV